MTPAQRDLILHTLGLPDRWNGKRPRWSHRNNYCTCIGDSTEVVLIGMVERGLMVAGRTINDGEARYYHVTRAGAEAAGVLGRCRMKDVER
jgi:hypothetical protein